MRTCVAQEPWHRRAADQHERDGPGVGQPHRYHRTDRTDGTVSPDRLSFRDPPGDGAAGQQDPDAILRRALSAAPDEGIPVSDLITVTGMSRRWVFYRLGQLAADGYAAQTVRGHWRTTR